MKKIIFSVLLLAVIFAIGFSGCLGGDDEASNTANNSTDSNNSSNNSSNMTDNSSNGSDNDSAESVAPPFDPNLTLVDPVPQDFIFFSTATVRSHGQHIGVTDVLFGYQGIYHYGENAAPVFLTFYDVEIANTTKKADDYIQMMKDSHVRQYGNDSIITTIHFNGHSATLFEAATAEVPQYGRYMIAWTLGDNMFVTVTGVVDASVLETLAAATEY